MLVDPRKAAAKAGSRYDTPETGSAAPWVPAYNTPASAPMKLDTMRQPRRTRSVLMPDKPRHLASAANEQHLPADRGELEHVPDQDAQQQRIVELERNPQQPVDDDQIHQPIGNAADRHRIADIQRQAVQERSGAKRHYK